MVYQEVSGSALRAAGGLLEPAPLSIVQSKSASNLALPTPAGCDAAAAWMPGG